MKIKLPSMPKSDKLSVLLIMTVIIVALGVQYFIEVSKDEDVAHQLMQRELRIVEQQLFFELYDAGNAANVLRPAVLRMLHHPDSLTILTRGMLRNYPNVTAVCIAFEPDYFPEKGHWFELVSHRFGDKIVDEQAGGPQHDYFKLEWYREGIIADRNRGRWVRPYYVEEYGGRYVSTFSLPIHDDEDRPVGVIAIDVTLDWLEGILKGAEPYKGSVCRLIDVAGNVLVTSSTSLAIPDNCFTDSMKVGNYNMQVILSCPQSAIYGETLLVDVVMFILLLICIVLILYIVRRNIRDMSRLDEAEENQRMIQSEMKVAHNIQMGILRTDFPEGFSARLMPMKDVGGDLYDFFEKDGMLWFIVGDVSGKGVSAAMMMGTTVTLFRSAVRRCNAPDEIVGELNSLLSEHNPGMMFVTAFVGRLDRRHGLLSYCCAGHNPPLLDGRVMDIEPDIPIGFQEDYRFHRHSCLFPEGSSLVLYTDGITEARGAQHQLMGLQRLHDIVAERSGETATNTANRILEATCRFAEGQAQADDMAVMCVVNNALAEHPSLTLSNTLSELTRAKTLLSEYCDAIGLTSKQTREMNLALEEALVNVINYAYPEGTSGLITLNITASSDAGGRHIALTLSDSGAPFDPTARPEADVSGSIDARREGGLGIYFYTNLMDDVSYRRSDDGQNILSMNKTYTI